MNFDASAARCLPMVPGTEFESAEGTPSMRVRDVRTGEDLLVRHALASDAPAIASLVMPHALRGDMLPLTEEAVLARLRAVASLGPFLVVEETSGSALAACGALRFWTSVDAEIRSLAVADARRGGGVGGALLDVLEAEAARRGAGVAFALTRAPGFFVARGYEEVAPGLFPHKRASDCAACPRRTACDERSMLKLLPHAR